MRLNGRAYAAAALAVSVGCGGSLPPPATQPTVAGRPIPSPAPAPAIDVLEPPPPATGAIAGIVIRADDGVTITDATSEVNGTVRDDRGRGAADAMVLITPAPQQSWSRTSRRFRLLRTDASGRFRVRGLPAGEYRAFATYDLDESETYRRDLLQTLVAQGEPLTVADRQRHAVDLPLVSLAATRRSASR